MDNNKNNVQVRVEIMEVRKEGELEDDILCKIYQVSVIQYLTINTPQIFRASIDIFLFGPFIWLVTIANTFTSFSEPIHMFTVYIDKPAIDRNQMKSYQRGNYGQDLCFSLLLTMLIHYFCLSCVLGKDCFCDLLANIHFVVWTCVLHQMRLVIRLMHWKIPQVFLTML